MLISTYVLQSTISLTESSVIEIHYFNKSLSRQVNRKVKDNIWAFKQNRTWWMDVIKSGNNVETFFKTSENNENIYRNALTSDEASIQRNRLDPISRSCPELYRTAN